MGCINLYCNFVIPNHRFINKSTTRNIHSIYLNLLAILHPQCKGCIMWSGPVTGAGVIGWRTAAKTQRYHQCLEHRGKSADTQKGASTLLSLHTIVNPTKSGHDPEGDIERREKQGWRKGKARRIMKRSGNMQSHKEKKLRHTKTKKDEESKQKQKRTKRKPHQGPRLDKSKGIDH